MPESAFMNSVHGLHDVALLDDVLAFYAQTEQCCWIDVTPGTPTEVTDALVAQGFPPASCMSVLYGLPRPCESAANVDVQRVAAEDLDVFLDTLNVGFDVPVEHLTGIRANQQFWKDVRNWRHYLARVDGEPAGAAVLAVTDGCGYLAAASTLPAFRRGGVHAALLSRRVHDAHELGCTLVCGQTPAGSGCQRNQQRAGLQIAHTKTAWTNARPGA